MKRFLCIFLILSIVFPCFGCTDKKIDEPATFYYLRRSNSFNSEDSIIAPETVDGSRFSNISLMLSSYFRGPSDLALESPFPAGTYLLDTALSSDLLVVTLSDNFALLNGIDLSLACCALAKTAMEYTGVEEVQIKAVTALLDGETSITIDTRDIVLYDTYALTATDSTE